MKVKAGIAAQLITTILAATALLPTTQAASFSDLSPSNPYATAIEYLSSFGIIQGYPDGSFRPNNNVNRAEFLKLVLESSQIPTDIITHTPFSDVDEQAWYGKYVRKATQEGWIEGYPDGTFKPEQFINKVEALKIVGQVQQWQTTSSGSAPFQDTPRLAWFTPYVSYAKNKNFLEETSSQYFPAQLLSRAQISELLFRAHITEHSDAETYNPALTHDLTKNPEPVIPALPSQDFAAVEAQTYPTDFFNNIILNEEIPNTFYLNEVYNIQGDIKSGSFPQAFAFLAPESAVSSDDYIDYSAPVNKQQINIPIHFQQVGNYKLGIILGSSGESKVFNISVLPQLPSLQSTPPPANPSAPQVEYKNYHTTFSWDSPPNSLTKLTIFQGSQTKIFYFRQNIQEFNIVYSDFANFSEGTTYARTETAQIQSQSPLSFSSNWSPAIQTSFITSQHIHTEISDNITVNNFPATLSSISNITFTGSADTDVAVETAIITPNGLVEFVNLSSPQPTQDYYGLAIIPAGNNFTFNYTPQQSGPHQIEINNKNGSAVFNTASYIQTGIPLIPDFLDNNIYASPTTDFQLERDRQVLLQFINQERQSLGLAAVTLDTNLNSLAQAHSQDMVNKGYFGHISPDGQSPNDRRIAAGIATPVGENLAIAPTVLYTHEGLMHSAIHRSNIVNPEWTKVGIGIVVDEDGSLVTTQEFSRNPLDDTDLATIENEILTTINQKRTTTGLPNLQIDTNINAAANDWTAHMINEDFFGFTSPSGASLAEIISGYISDRPVQGLILEGNSGEQITNEILPSEYITDSQWQKIGISVKSTSLDQLKATILFTTN